MCKNCDAWYSGYPDHRERNVYQESDEYDAPHKKVSQKKKPQFIKAPKGCPGNDGKAHVYVIIQYNGWRSKWTRVPDQRTWESTLVPYAKYKRVCVGCDRIAKTYYGSWRDSNPVGRDFNESDIYEVRSVRKQDWYTV